MNKRHLLPLVVVLLLSLLLVACGGSGAATTEVPPETEAATEAPATQAPTETPTEPPTPTPTEAPKDVAVDNFVFFEDANGTVHVSGKVTNYTDKPVTDVELSATLTDDGGSVVAKETGYTASDVIYPGQSDYFDIIIYDEVEGATQAEAEVASYDLDESGFSPLEMTIQGLSEIFVEDEGTLYVAGEMVNDNDESAHIHGLSLAALDEEGNVLAVGDASSYGRMLLPGESTPFLLTIENYGPGVDGAAIDIVATASQTDETFDYVFSFPDDIHFAPDNFGDIHLVGSVVNENDEPMSVSLIGALYDENGNVLDAVTLDVPYDPLDPGATGTYDFDYWHVLNADPEIVDQVAAYSIQVDNYWTWSMDYTLMPMDATIDDLSSDGYTIAIEGTVTNNGDTAVENVSVIVNLYDQDGNLVATGDTFMVDGLSIGDSTDFSLYIYPPDDVDSDSLTPEVIALGKKVS